MKIKKHIPLELLQSEAPAMYQLILAFIESSDQFEDVWSNGGHDTRHFCGLCGESMGHDEDCPVGDAIKLVKHLNGDEKC